MRSPRRNHSAAFKAKLALAAVKSDQTLAQLAERFDVHSYPRPSDSIVGRFEGIVLVVVL